MTAFQSDLRDVIRVTGMETFLQQMFKEHPEVVNAKSFEEVKEAVKAPALRG